jgi:hypothetical protein
MVDGLSGPPPAPSPRRGLFHRGAATFRRSRRAYCREWLLACWAAHGASRISKRSASSAVKLVPLAHGSRSRRRPTTGRRAEPLRTDGTAKPCQPAIAVAYRHALQLASMSSYSVSMGCTLPDRAPATHPESCRPRSAKARLPRCPRGRRAPAAEETGGSERVCARSRHGAGRSRLRIGGYHQAAPGSGVRGDGGGIARGARRASIHRASTRRCSAVRPARASSSRLRRWATTGRSGHATPRSPYRPSSSGPRRMPSGQARSHAAAGVTAGQPLAEARSAGGRVTLRSGVIRRRATKPRRRCTGYQPPPHSRPPPRILRRRVPAPRFGFAPATNDALRVVSGWRSRAQARRTVVVAQLPTTHYGAFEIMENAFYGRTAR